MSTEKMSNSQARRDYSYLFSKGRTLEEVRQCGISNLLKHLHMESCRQEKEKSIRPMVLETVTFCESVIGRCRNIESLAPFQLWLSMFYLWDSEYGMESATTHGSQEPTCREGNGQNSLIIIHSLRRQHHLFPRSDAASTGCCSWLID